MAVINFSMHKQQVNSISKRDPDDHYMHKFSES